MSKIKEWVKWHCWIPGQCQSQYRKRFQQIYSLYLKPIKINSSMESDKQVFSQFVVSNASMQIGNIITNIQFCVADGVHFEVLVQRLGIKAYG